MPPCNDALSVFDVDLLQKSLKVLTSSSVLSHKLRQLQQIEALQRKGVVLQDAEAQQEVEVIGFFLFSKGCPPGSSRLNLPIVVFQCSQCCGGVASRLEELVETLQDRRRRADQAFMLLIQQQQESKRAESQVRDSVFL